MLQKEVGERIIAAPGSKAYGILSVLIRTCATVSPLLVLGPGHFHPRPKVDSLVLRLVFHPPPPPVEGLPDCDQHLLFRLVNAAFQQRRKTLLNALSAGRYSGLRKPEIERIIRAAAISPSIRAERLTVADYVRLTLCFQEKLSG